MLEQNKYSWVITLQVINCQDLKHCPIPPHSLGTEACPLSSPTSSFTPTHIPTEGPEICSSFLCLPVGLFCEFWRAMRPFRQSTWWVNAPLSSDYYDYILCLNSWSPVTYFQLRTRVHVPILSPSLRLQDLLPNCVQQTQCIKTPSVD